MKIKRKDWEAVCHDLETLFIAVSALETILQGAGAMMVAAPDIARKAEDGEV